MILPLELKDYAQFILLLDPDKLKLNLVKHIVEQSIINGVDIFFIGSSLIIHSDFDLFVAEVKKYSEDK